MGDYYGPADHEKKLVARIAELEAALRPFAEHGERITERYPDEESVETDFPARIFRAAAKAMEGK